MNDENLIPVAPETAQPNDHSEHALFGKIARLPHAIREELNQRLLDGQSGTDILAWVNELQPVRDILNAKFGGKPINGPNLTHWRKTGYDRWYREQQNICAAEKLAQYAQKLLQASGGQLAPAAASLAAGKIIELLTADNANPDHVLKCAVVASDLAKTEQNNARIKIANDRLQSQERRDQVQHYIAHERIRQGDDQLLLLRDKHQRDVTAVGLRVLGDARAEQVEACSCNYPEKIEMLGRHLFSRQWRHRSVTPYVKQQSPPASGEKSQI